MFSVFLLVLVTHIIIHKEQVFAMKIGEYIHFMEWEEFLKLFALLIRITYI